MGLGPPARSRALDRSQNKFRANQQSRRGGPAGAGILWATVSILLEVGPRVARLQCRRGLERWFVYVFPCLFWLLSNTTLPLPSPVHSSQTQTDSVAWPLTTQEWRQEPLEEAPSITHTLLPQILAVVGAKPPSSELQALAFCGNPASSSLPWTQTLAVAIALHGAPPTPAGAVWTRWTPQLTCLLRRETFTCPPPPTLYSAHDGVVTSQGTCSL